MTLKKSSVHNNICPNTSHSQNKALLLRRIFSRILTYLQQYLTNKINPTR